MSCHVSLSSFEEGSASPCVRSLQRALSLVLFLHPHSSSIQSIFSCLESVFFWVFLCVLQLLTDCWIW